MAFLTPTAVVIGIYGPVQTSNNHLLSLNRKGIQMREGWKGENSLPFFDEPEFAEASEERPVVNGNFTSSGASHLPEVQSMTISRTLIRVALAVTLSAAAMSSGCNVRTGPQAATQPTSDRATTEPSLPELAFELRLAEAYYAGTGDEFQNQTIDLQLSGNAKGVHVWFRRPKEMTGSVSLRVGLTAESPQVWLVYGANWEDTFYRGGAARQPPPEVQKEQGTGGLLEFTGHRGRVVVTLRDLRFPSGVIRQIGPVEARVEYYRP